MIMRILVKGITIRHLAFALEALVSEDDVQIHIITEEPEIGLSQSLQPGSKMDSHPILKILVRHFPRDVDMNTFVRGMWISRALGIESAERGALIHLRSSLILITDKTFQIVGAGQISNDPIVFDYIYEPEFKESEKWFGASFSCPCSEEKCLSRGDGTCEYWSKKPIQTKTALETSTWLGKDPHETVSVELEKGIADAREFLESPKYS